MGIPQPLLSPVYQFPFPDEKLVIIGRITLMWGQIDVQVDQILMDLYRLGYDKFDHLFANKTVGPKTEAVRVALDRSRDNLAREALVEMATSVSSCVSERNIMTHGLWGWRYEPDNGLWHQCAWSRPKDRLFYARDLVPFHNKMAEAARKTDTAWHLQIMGTPPPTNMNRKYMFSPLDPGVVGAPPDYIR